MRNKILILGFCVAAGAYATPADRSARGQLSNMNGLYKISNPHPSQPEKFSTDYSTYENVEYFDVYSPPITSRYGEVYWTMMDAVPLDPKLVERNTLNTCSNQFNGKVMAIVGYEADQVMREADGDVSVPITWAYNHHFEAYLTGASSEMRLTTPEEARKNDHHGAYGTWHAFKKENVDALDPNPKVPTAQWFSEGNGGEFRKSFHGYPRGTAQLIESPQTFSIEPMQIDTKNRFYNGSDFRPGILPAASAAPPNAAYSGLLECPCATRIPRNISNTFNTTYATTCAADVDGPDQCLEAVRSFGFEGVSQLTTIDSESDPRGCFMKRSSGSSPQLFFNRNSVSKVPCKMGPNSVVSGNFSSDTAKVEFAIKVDTSVKTITMELSGPADKWYGVGLNTPNFAMSDQPYTVVVDGKGNVQERKLGNHSPGVVLPQMLKVTANSVKDGVRTVTGHLSVPEATNAFGFDASAAGIDLIVASGDGATYAYHGKTRAGGTLHFTADEGSTCVCNAGVKGTINNVPFSKNCLPEPKGDLLAQKNPTCFADTYQGGLACCHHGIVLLDTEQEQPEEPMTYHMKFRFWFQEYSEEAGQPSHQNLIRVYWQTEALAGEYDVVQCADGTKPEDCVQTIRSNFTVRDMMNDCEIRSNPGCWGNVSAFDGIELTYAAGHCHAPSCLLMELYNADTDELLCRHDPVYGQSHEVFDELGYLAIPPCLYGPEEEGLMPPTFLSYDTKLYSIKQNNNTYTHYGEMASWQMRGVLAKKPTSSS